MKKFFKLTAAAALSISLLAACGGGQDDNGTTTPATSDDVKVELVFWEFGNTGYDVLIEQYEKANPHVSINLQNSNMNDLHDNLFTSISAGSGAPDIAMVETGSIERFKVATEGFENLYNYGAGDVKGDFLEWVWRTGESADGSIQFGLPTDIGPTVMFYRTDIFEEAGFESTPEAVSELVATWEDYKTVAKQIKENTGKLMSDSAGLVYNNRRDQSKQQHFNTSNELIVNDHDGIRKAFTYAGELLQEGLVGDVPLWTPEWYAGMAGDYATMLAPAWMQGVIKDNEPEEGVWSITTMPEGAGNWGGSYLTIPSQTKHAEEAYKFIEWLTAPNQQLQAFLGYGLFPSAPAVYDMPDFMNYTDDYFGGIATAQVFGEAAQAVEPVYKGPFYYPVDDEFHEGITNIAAGSDIDAEWDEAVIRIKRILERQ